MKKLFIMIGSFIIPAVHGMQAPAPMGPQLSEILQLENAIKQKYNLDAVNCYPAVSKTNQEAKGPFRKIGNISNANHWLACVVTGYKNVLLTYSQFFKNIDPELVKLMQEKNIKKIMLQVPGKEKITTEEELEITLPQVNIIIYNTQGERNAWLLAIHELEKIIAEKEDTEMEGGSYLMGFLLNYIPQDIEFFYKQAAFLEKYGPIPYKPFDAWPATRKKQFAELENDWERDVYQDASSKGQFLKDKESTERWIQHKSQFNIQELMQQVDQLLLKLGGKRLSL